MIGVYSIDSLFSKFKIDEKGTGDESNLFRRRPKNSEFLDLDAKFVKVGLERS